MMVTRWKWVVASLATLAFAFAGCGGNTADATTEVAPEAPGSNCPNGGIVVT